MVRKALAVLVYVLSLISFAGLTALASGYSAAGGTVSAPLTLTGATDAVQLTVKGNGTQTANIFELRKSDNSLLFAVDNNGTVGPGAITPINFISSNTIQPNGSNVRLVAGGDGSINLFSLGAAVPTLDLTMIANQTAPPLQIIGASGATGHGWDLYGTDGSTLKAYAAIDGTINSAASVQAGNGTAGVTSGGDFSTTAVGHGLILKSGSNGLVGSGTLSGGTATVNNTAIGANDIVIPVDTGGTVTNLGALYEDKASRVTNTSFVIKSSNALDASNFSYVIIKVQ